MRTARAQGMASEPWRFEYEYAGSFKEIDGERSPFPRPRTLAQEVEVQRRRCRPCVRCREVAASAHWFSYTTPWDNQPIPCVGFQCCCDASPAFPSPAHSRKVLNTQQARRLAPKGIRAFDALKARLKAANESIQRAEAIARHWMRCHDNNFAERVRLAAENATLATRVEELEARNRALESEVLGDFD